MSHWQITCVVKRCPHSCSRTQLPLKTSTCCTRQQLTLFYTERGHSINTHWMFKSGLHRLVQRVKTWKHVSQQSDWQEGRSESSIPDRYNQYNLLFSFVCLFFNSFTVNYSRSKLGEEVFHCFIIVYCGGQVRYKTSNLKWNYLLELVARVFSALGYLHFFSMQKKGFIWETWQGCKMSESALPSSGVCRSLQIIFFY